LNIEKKLKVVWICHFSNNEVLSWIKPWFKRKEIAPWIPNLIKGFIGRNDIELHVISLHSGIPLFKKYKKDGVKYYFVNYGIPFLGIPWQSFFPFDILTNYLQNKLIIKYFVNKIKPDIITLFGAENANYSSSILQFRKKYPVLIIIQGFIGLGFKPNRLKEKKRVKVETEILKKFIFFAGEFNSTVYLSSLNNQYSFFKFYGPVNEELVNKISFSTYRYDIIYYGRLIKEKGIEDFIKIIGKLKNDNPSIKAIAIGDCNSNYMKFLKELVKNYDCNSNIIFTGFLESQEDIFNYIKSSKILLVPTYNDRLPQTIRDTMMLKTAVIAYKTGGIPYINKAGNNIVLVDIGDYESMKQSAAQLLKDENYRRQLIENAYFYAKSEFGLKNITSSLINTYSEIIKNNPYKKATLLNNNK